MVSTCRQLSLRIYAAFLIFTTGLELISTSYRSAPKLSKSLSSQYPKRSVFPGDPYIGVLYGQNIPKQVGIRIDPPCLSIYLCWWSAFFHVHLNKLIFALKEIKHSIRTNDFLLHFLQRFAGFIAALKELIGYRVLHDRNHFLLESHSAA